MPQNKKIENIFNARTIEWIGRVAIFIVFFWFGFLKIIDMSPAKELVEALAAKTIPFVPFDAFYLFLGVWEAAIGVLFLFPRLTKWALGIMLVQMFTTFGPLVFLPKMVWQVFLLAPNLEGQYVIKNVVLIALALFVYHSNREQQKESSTK